MKRFPFALVVFALLLTTLGTHAQSGLPTLPQAGVSEIHAILQRAVQLESFV